MVIPEKAWFADWGVEHQSAVLENTPLDYKFALNAGSGAEVGLLEFNDVPFSRGNAEGIENSKIKVTHAPQSFSRL